MNEATVSALAEALDDEYRARATYRAVLDRFGADVRPFSNIVQSEQRHIDALLSLYEQFGLQPPADRWAGRAEAPDTLEGACRRGVQAERENEQMYERLIEASDEAAVTAVFVRLAEASSERHLRAFERCLGREQRGGHRGGGGRRQRRRHRRERGRKG